MTRQMLLLTGLALISGCSEPIDTSFQRELDRAAQDRGIPPLPVLRSDEPRVYRAAKLADPFYPNDLRR
jgi:Tfp pilus assembly protein PilP